MPVARRRIGQEIGHVGELESPRRIAQIDEAGADELSVYSNSRRMRAARVIQRVLKLVAILTAIGPGERTRPGDQISRACERIGVGVANHVARIIDVDDNDGIVAWRPEDRR